jgi:uncharacterized protein YdhG (YjbR/CyaY superfamily)
MAEARTKTSTKGFSAAEKAAMQARARELKGAAGESDALAKIAELQQPDRAMAERLHAIIKAAASGMSAKTYYGMPAYAKDDNLICWFKPAQKFNTRYATLEFGDKANLDDGDIWPVSFALKELTAANEARIAALVKKAVS